MANPLGAAIGLSLTDPRRAAAAILALRLPRPVLVEALILVTALGTLAALLGSAEMQIVLPLGETGALVFSPFLYALLLGSALTVTALAIDLVGRMMGGAGKFADALALVVWIEVLALVVRLAQMAAFLLSSLVGAIVSIAGLGLLLWCLINFVRVLHGFDGPGRAAAVLILSFLGIGFGLSLILALIGVGATTTTTGA
ncbi:Yip1 family protein [Wenxinia saemankumensis]|uniref:Yip1 domain-containing protein n=1 Tax=Wenxinia saemankumensis TaxID=1447782 RepID=A0A1M6H3P8_9RHOB|nr:Yip1 family protein [Wenxinia saemankumensis]SHJ16810.1 Yip1 domain-containing protein [Wenxinia saemankumensis]